MLSFLILVMVYACPLLWLLAQEWREGRGKSCGLYLAGLALLGLAVALKSLGL